MLVTSMLAKGHSTAAIVHPKKLETGLRTISAGSPYVLLFRIEASGFPTDGLLLYPTAKRLISILIASFNRGFLSANSKGCGLGVRESGFAAV